MASRYSIEAVFKAIDKITAPVTRMQNRMGKFTRSTEAGLKRVDAATSKLNGAMWTGAKVGAVALAGAAVSVHLALKDVADEADRLAKFSRRIDFPIEELQEWQFAADQSGISNELFQKSLESFTKRLGEARAGTGSLYSMLKRMDVQTLKQLQRTNNAAEALEIYVDAMRKAPSAAKRAAMAAAAFSRAGMKMGDLATNSAEAIAALRAEMRANGLITMDAAQNAEAYNDAQNSLKLALRGLQIHGLLPLTPILTDLIRRGREWIVTNREMVSDRLQQGLNWMIENFSSIVTWIKRISIGLGVFIAFSAVLKTLIGVMTLLNLVMAANPVGLIVIGVAALAAAVAGVIIYWDELKAKFLALPGPVKAALTVLSGPIGWLIWAANKIMDNWEPIKGFFTDAVDGIISAFKLLKATAGVIWDNIVGNIERKVRKIAGIVDTVKGAFNTASSWLGFGGDEPQAQGAGGSPAPQVVSPQERAARYSEEYRSTSTAEVLIRDETGRAEMRQRGDSPGANVQLLPSGGF